MVVLFSVRLLNTVQSVLFTLSSLTENVGNCWKLGHVIILLGSRDWL